jgi:RNA recognition motif-containing protein
VNISEARSSRREYDGERGERAPRDGERGERAPRERNYDFDARKVYFGNLSWGMDHLDLQDLCGEYGEVADSRLITDRETGRSRGFGFVTMSSAEQAEKVVNGLNGQDVDGRVLRVNIANVDGR